VLEFPERLNRFKKLQGLGNEALGRMLGVNGSTVAQIVRREKNYSRPLEVLLDHLEREATEDPFLAGCEKILRALVWTLTYTGLRKMSGLGLTAENLTERLGWIRGRDQKGRKPIWLPVIPEFKTVLKGLGVVAGPLFRAPDGSPLTRFPEERWREARVAAGLPGLHVHDLRHLCGSLLSEAGVPPRVIQEWMGHSTLRMTERYTHPQEQGFQDAARLLGKRVRAARVTKIRSNVPTKPLESTNR
jgi:integrase